MYTSVLGDIDLFVYHDIVGEYYSIPNVMYVEFILLGIKVTADNNNTRSLHGQSSSAAGSWQSAPASVERGLLVLDMPGL